MPCLKWITSHPLTTLAVAATTMVGSACSDSTNAPSQPEASFSVTYTAKQFDATAKPKFTTEGG